MSQALASLITRESLAARLLPALVELAAAPDARTSWLPAALSRMARESGLTPLIVARGRKGIWECEAATGTAPKPLPEEILLAALDEENCIAREHWLAAPLQSPPEDGRVLLGRGDLAPAEFRALAATLGLVGRWLAQLRSQTRRAERLRAVLEVTVNWKHTEQTGELLRQIAETSTRLLGAERATIFLIDPVRNLLVGRPALGVEGGELLLPVDSGVVGHAIRDKAPQRVDRGIASEQAQVNRAIDRQLKFETRTLLCVPMVDAKDKVIGAFELINKRDGNFTDEDEQDLTELALHASAAIGSSRHVETLNQARRTVADQAASQVNWIGQSAGMEKILSTIQRVADTDLAILITGENGTGKEVVAQKIHYLSSRRDQPLVAVNCAAITETLLESELFGHEKGSLHRRPPVAARQVRTGQ